MNKKLLIPLAALTVFMLLSVTSYAGDINDAEQSIINLISGTFEYNGAYYRVPNRYITQVLNYLSEDGRDMTDSQASEYISQFYENFATGIESGYLVKVGDVSDESSDSGGTSASDNSTANGGTSNSGGTSAGGNSTTNGGTSNSSGTSAGGNSASAGGTSTTGDSSGSKGQSKTEDGNSVDPGTVISIDSLVSGNAGLTEDGEIQDNTIGSTTDGEIEYTVFEVDDIVMYVWGIDELEVHTEAYKDSNVLGTVASGDKITVTGSATTGWAQVEYNGEVGYVSAVYLRTKSYIDSINEDVEEEENITDEPTQKEERDDMTEDVQEQEEEVVKDYSDAAPVARSVNVAMIAVAIAVVFCIIMGIVIFLNRSKMKNRVRNK